MHAHRLRASLFSFALALTAPLLAGCPPSHGPQGPGGEQRALAEYDVAADALRRGKLREALEHIQTSIKLNDEAADAHYLAAVIMLQFCSIDEKSSDCRYGEVERYARKALEVNADQRDAKNILGVVLVHEARYDDAIAVLKPLANDILYGSPELAWGNLGKAYLKKGAFDEAIDALRRAIAAQPLYCTGNYDLGLAFEGKSEWASAREAFTKALETDDEKCKRLQDGFEARGRVEEKLKLGGEAHDDFVKCRDLAPKTPSGQRCASRLGSAP